jgi:hypothetical protein
VKGKWLFFLFPSFAWGGFFYQPAYQSARTLGMGGCSTVTGLYDDNFYGNPARIGGNPRSKWTFFQLGFELNDHFYSISKLLQKNRLSLLVYQKYFGKVMQARLAMLAPAFYLAAHEDRKWSLATALTSQFAGIGRIRRSLAIEPLLLWDTVFHVGSAYEFSRQHLFRVGLMSHWCFRDSVSAQEYLVDYIQTQKFLSPSPSGMGFLMSWDLGLTARVLDYFHYKVDLGMSVQNIFNTRFLVIPSRQGSVVQEDLRQYNIGIAFIKPYFFSLKNTQIVFELNHIGAFQDNLFKSMHFGIETTYGLFCLRTGLNQGYFAAGLGMKWEIFGFDLATTAQEIGTNVGQLEDRRYVLSAGIHI